SRRHELYFVPSAVPASASQIASASSAAHKVLVTFYAGQAAKFDAIHAATLAGISDSPQKRRGLAWGESVAEQILSSRAKDGSDATVAPPSGTGPGYWAPT